MPGPVFADEGLADKAPAAVTALHCAVGRLLRVEPGLGTSNWRSPPPCGCHCRRISLSSSTILCVQALVFRQRRPPAPPLPPPPRPPLTPHPPCSRSAHHHLQTSRCCGDNGLVASLPLPAASQKLGAASEDAVFGPGTTSPNKGVSHGHWEGDNCFHLANIYCQP